MASPFRIFRKYLKPLMVVFGVMIMFVFVILDPMAAYLGGGRGGMGRSAGRGQGDVAVSWDDGSLTNQEVSNLVQRRRIVNAFIRGVAMTGAQAAIEAGTDPREITYPVQPIIGPETPAEGVESNVVQTKLFADAARDAGMHVSDEAIVSYLDELGRGNVTREQMRDMLSRLPGDVRVPIQFVMDAIRDEMLARNYVASYAYAFDTVTPDQRYKDWLSVNDRVVIEAAPIAVDSFKIDVAEPTEAELTKFFDDHKNREPQPDFIGRTEYPSPTPGFRIPRKIDVQYVQAEYDQLLAKLEDEVTEEEIAKYYEENKELFIRADASVTGLPEDQPSAPADQLPEEEPSDTPAADANQNTDPQSTDPAAETESDATEPGTAPEAGLDSQPADTSVPPADETQTAPPADSESTPADGDQSSHGKARRSGVFQLAAFLQDAETETETAAEPAAETPAPSDEPPATTDAAAPPSGDPADGQTDAAAADAPASATETGITGEAAAATDAQEAPTQFQSLDEVRDLIRREIAARKVSEQLGTLMNELHTQVNGEFTRYFGKRLDAEAKELAPPAPPAELADLKPLAQKHGLKHGQTGPLSVLELRSTPVGASGNIDRQSELFRILFGSDDLELYEPVSTQDVDGNRYLAMKTSDTPGRVPQLAEVRKDVVDAWKRQKAAEIGLKHAEEQAKKAQESNSTLSNFFADKSVEVLRTDPFARFTGGEIGVVDGEFQQQPFRLSEPDGIVAAGPAFMDKVFDLNDGEVGAVLNHDKSIAYVVRVAEHQMSDDELRSTYLSEANSWPGGNIMTRGHAQNAARFLAADILVGKGLKWERTPDPQEEEEEEPVE